MGAFIPTPAVFGGSLARPFAYHTRGVHQSPQVRWAFPFSGNISCPLLVDLGVIYVGDWNGYFSAIQASTGDLLWSVDSSTKREVSYRNPVVAACVDGTTGYISCYEGLYELDLRTGHLVHFWNENAYRFEVPEFLALSDEVVICGTRVIERSSRVKIDHRDGFYLFLGGSLALTVHKGMVFGFTMLNNNGDMAFDTDSVFSDSSFQLWVTRERGLVGKKIVEAYLLQTPTVPILDGTLFTVGKVAEDFNPWDPWDTPFSLGRRTPCQVIAFAPETGAIQWRCWLSRPFDPREFHYGSSYPPVALAAASSLVFVRAEHWIEAVDTATHLPRWTWNSEASTAHHFVADSLLYVFDRQGRITALTIETGEERWSWQMKGEMREQWSASHERQAVFGTIADGTLYVAAGHTLYALSEPGGGR